MRASLRRELESTINNNFNGIYLHVVIKRAARALTGSRALVITNNFLCDNITNILTLKTTLVQRQECYEIHHKSAQNRPQNTDTEKLHILQKVLSKAESITHDYKFGIKMANATAYIAQLPVSYLTMSWCEKQQCFLLIKLACVFDLIVTDLGVVH